MLRWEKLIDPPRHQSGKVLICGHTRQLSGWPLVHETVICIDTSIYSRGWLTCLEVETGRFWQANMQGEVRESHLEVLSIFEEKSARDRPA
jgi:serine/threonine protein phosphatase 1